MNRFAGFFIGVLAPILAFLLAYLGVLTLQDNLLGFFLVISGSFYGVGVIIIYWIRRIEFWNPQAGDTTQAEEAGDRSFWLILPGMGGSFFLAPVEFLLAPEWIPRGNAFEWSGLMLVILGAVLFVWARRVIKRGYSGHLAVTENQELVKNGPYSIIRHPSYASFLLMALGVSLGYSSTVAFLLTVMALLPGLIYRIHVEDELLEKHFQKDFEDYSRRTARLIPGIW